MKLSAFFSARSVAAGLAWLAVGATLALAQVALPRAQVGVPYSFQVATNPPAPAGTIYRATGLPLGLSINASSGAIAGTPTAAGTASGNISLESGGITNAFAYTLLVDPAAGTPVISSAATATATVGAPFTFNVTATNTPTSYNVGALPSGLAFNAGTGLISGTPTVAGTFSIPLSANNAIGTGATATLTLTVNPAGPVPAITSATTASASAVTPATNPASYTVNYQITATQNPTSYSAAGLPFGLGVNAATGLIGGTTTVTGMHTVALSASNANGAGPVTNVTLTIGALPQITSAANLAVTVNQAMASFTLTASNSPQTFSVAGLPPGLSVNATTGIISGTPTATGNFTVTVSAANSIGMGPSSTLNLSVNASTPIGGGGGTGGGTGGGVPVVTLPIFTTHPTSQSVTAGTAVTFTAQAAGTAPITYQWRKDGVAIGGATSASLTLTSTSTVDTGTYTVVATNSAGSVTSLGAALTVTGIIVPPPVEPALPPVIVTAPAGSTINVGQSISLAVVANGTGPLTYQWNKDGVAISGATSASLTVGTAPASATGSYTVTVTNAGGSVTSSAAVVVVLPPSSQLINLSTRGMVRTGEGILIAGFVIRGDAPNPVLIRAIGPSLSGFGVPGTLTDPVLELFNQSGASVGRNDNWGTAAGANSATELAGVAQRVGAFALTTGTADAVIYTTLAPGAYTAQVSGTGNGTGLGLVEIYDASATTTGGARLLNVATRGDVGVDDNLLMAGFVVRGSAAKRVLVRAAGPALTAFGVTTALANPRLQLFRDGALVNQNDDWGSAGDAAQVAAAATSVGAFAFANGSADAVLLLTLEPGAYSAHVSGVGNTTGTALIEVYELP